MELIEIEFPTTFSATRLCRNTFDVKARPGQPGVFDEDLITALQLFFDQRLQFADFAMHDFKRFHGMFLQRSIDKIENFSGQFQLVHQPSSKREDFPSKVTDLWIKRNKKGEQRSEAFRVFFDFRADV